MLTSKTIGQIIEVLRTLKEDILTKLSEGEEVTTEQAESMIIDVFKKVGQDSSVSESTIRSQCTREIGLKSDEFYKLAIEYLTRQNNNLEDILVEHRKDTLDDDVQIKVLMRKIRDQ